MYILVLVLSNSLIANFIDDPQIFPLVELCNSELIIRRDGNNFLHVENQSVRLEGGDSIDVDIRFNSYVSGSHIISLSSTDARLWNSIKDEVANKTLRESTINRPSTSLSSKSRNVLIYRLEPFKWEKYICKISIMKELPQDTRTQAKVRVDVHLVDL